MDRVPHPEGGFKYYWNSVITTGDAPGIYIYIYLLYYMFIYIKTPI